MDFLSGGGGDDGVDIGVCVCVVVAVEEVVDVGKGGVGVGCETGCSVIGGDDCVDEDGVGGVGSVYIGVGIDGVGVGDGVGMKSEGVELKGGGCSGVLVGFVANGKIVSLNRTCLLTKVLCVVVS